MRTIMIESPLEYATARHSDNVAYAKRCIQDAFFERKEAPFLSHLLYPGALDDRVPDQRHRAIVAGHAIAAKLDAWVFYLDRGLSRGMLEGLDAAVEAGFRPWSPFRMQSWPERTLVFRVFRGEDRSRDLRLPDCTEWPALIEKIQSIAKREWDLP